MGRRRMDDSRSEYGNAVEDFAAAKLKPATDIKHREWREVLRDVQAVREGLDGTSSGDSSAYEALERLKQDIRSGINSRKWGARPDDLLADVLRLQIENGRLRE
jgi:hypothetical protein